jgi:hypothetical protein
MSNTTRRDVLKSGALAGLAGLAGCNDQKNRTKNSSPTRPVKQKAEWEKPPAQKGNDLNLIVLVADSFRADNLAAYGSQWIETPNLNQFARESVVFDGFYPEGMPTIPTRRQLYTGRRIFPTHFYFQQESVKLPGWHEMFVEDVTLAETLQASGYATALIADLPHLFKPGRNFHRGFTFYEWIRGQEVDFYAQAPRTIPDFSSYYPQDYIQLVESTIGANNHALTGFLNQYLANKTRWKQHGNSIAEITAISTINWLKENHDQSPFYLQVEIFDPHEPWDPPAHFLEKYLKDPTKHSWPEPPYGDVKVSEEGVKRLRANYAGEASNVDYWYGKVLQKIKHLGLYASMPVSASPALFSRPTFFPLCWDGWISSPPLGSQEKICGRSSATSKRTSANTPSPPSAISPPFARRNGIIPPCGTGKSTRETMRRNSTISKTIRRN